MGVARDLAVLPSDLVCLGVTGSMLDLGESPGEAGSGRTRVGLGAAPSRLSFITVGLVNISPPPSPELFASPSTDLLSVLFTSSFFFSLRTWDRRLSYL